MTLIPAVEKDTSKVALPQKMSYFKNDNPIINDESATCLILKGAVSTHGTGFLDTLELRPGKHHFFVSFLTDFEGKN